MTKYKQLTLHSNGIVEGWETEEPTFNDFNFDVVEYNDKIRNWISSKKELKCAEGELEKIERAYIMVYHSNELPFDITSIAEVREGLVYFKSDNVTQCPYQTAIELIVKHLGKNRGELIEILKKELIIKGICG